MTEASITSIWLQNRTLSFRTCKGNVPSLPARNLLEGIMILDAWMMNSISRKCWHVYLVIQRAVQYTRNKTNYACIKHVCAIFHCWIPSLAVGTNNENWFGLIRLLVFEKDAFPEHVCASSLCWHDVFIVFMKRSTIDMLYTRINSFVKCTRINVLVLSVPLWSRAY